MEWFLYLALLDAQIEQFCSSLFHRPVDCNEIVMECALDGEKIEWCIDSYLKSKKEVTHE